MCIRDRYILLYIWKKIILHSLINFINNISGILIASHKSHPCAGTGNIKTLAPVNAFSMIVHFFGSPQREADFWNPWNSQFHDAQNPSEKQCFIFDHKFHEIWGAQNPSHTSHYCILIVPAGDFLKKQESALPRIMALVFFSCCRAHASTHSWFFQDLPSENRFFHRLIAKSVIGVQVFHLGHQICYHHFRIFQIEWESL